MNPRKRRSSPWPLAGVAILLLILPSAATQKTRLTALAAFIPFQGLAHRALGLFGGLGSSGRTQELQTQVDYYKDQLQKLTLENKALETKLEQVSGLKQTLRDPGLRVLHADILLPTDGSPWRKSLTVSLGTRRGVEKGMLVLYNNQVVGRVIETGPFSSRVQTVTDPGFRAGAVAAPRAYTAGVSFAERRVGVYEGTSGRNGQLKWLTGETPVEEGAFVLTTEDPLNGIPRGLVLGRVGSAGSGRGASLKVEVEPLLNFRGLEHVMILVPPSPPATAKTGP